MLSFCSLIHLFPLTFVISFFVLILHLVCSFFIIPQGIKLNCDLRSFFFFFKVGVYHINSFLELLMLQFISFDMLNVYFPFSLVSAYDFISLLIISLTYWLFRNVLFNCHIFVGIFLLLLKVSYYFCQKAYLKQVQYY